MVASLLGFVGLLRDFGLSAATVQKTTISHGELSALFWFNLLVGMLMTLVLAVSAPFVVRFYGRTELLWLTRAYAGIAIISSLGIQHLALMQRQMRFGAIAARDLLATVIGMIAGIVSALAGQGYWALVVQQGVSVAVGTIFLWWRSGWLPGPPRWVSGIGQSLSFGGSMTVSNLLMYFNHNIDVILLGRKFGDVVVGLYSRAQGLLSKPLDQVLPPIMSVAVPMLSRLAPNPQRFKVASFRLIQMACFGGCLLVMNTMPTADWIVRLILGEQWTATADIFRILALFGLLEPLAYLLGAMLVASGKPAAMAQWRLVTTVAVVFSFLVGLRWGAIGIAVSYALSGIATRVWLVFFVGKRIGVSGWEFLRAGSPFVLFAGAISEGVSLFRRAWEPKGSLVGLLIFAPLATSVFVGGILCFPSGRSFLKELSRTASDALKSVRARSAP